MLLLLVVLLWLLLLVGCEVDVNKRAVKRGVLINDKGDTCCAMGEGKSLVMALEEVNN